MAATDIGNTQSPVKAPEDPLSVLNGTFAIDDLLSSPCPHDHEPASSCPDIDCHLIDLRDAWTRLQKQRPLIRQLRDALEQTLKFHPMGSVREQADKALDACDSLMGHKI